MKKFELYRNVRKKAMIWGLPISMFALMMIAVIGSLLVIIFSFSFAMIISVVVLNAVLYISLTRISANPQLLQYSKVFPKIITLKRSTGIDYE
ncbi:MAG: hypothetical protein ABJ092_14900 [Gillisia sp.]